MIQKIGSVQIDFAEIQQQLSQMQPSSTTDSAPEYDFLQQHGHTDIQLNNCRSYTDDKLVNFKYKGNWLIKYFPDEFLLQRGLDTEFKTVVILSQPPGNFVAPHYDQYQSSGFAHKPVVRLWVPLEDSKFGQVFCVGDQVLSNFKAGDVYQFDNPLHSSANAGLDYRYTMVVYTTLKNIFN
jgi:hypothetical protein